MEKIKIVSIIEKPTRAGSKFWAVNYDNLDKGINNCSATIGLWDREIARKIEDDVKLGGVCNVKIEQKGEYFNITKVEMCAITESEKVVDNREVQSKKEVPRGLMSAKDSSIVSQCCLKGCVELRGLIKGDMTLEDEEQWFCETMQMLVKVYKVGVSELEK